MEKLILELNKSVANLSVLYMKLHNFHWNVKGERFLELHEYYEKAYDGITEDLDEVAEQILMLGYTPVSKLSEQLPIALVQEVDASESVNGLTHTLNDFETLLKHFKEIKDLANELDVVIIDDLMTQLIVKYTKQVWILKALLNK